MHSSRYKVKVALPPKLETFFEALATQHSATTESNITFLRHVAAKGCEISNSTMFALASWRTIAEFAEAPRLFRSLEATTSRYYSTRSSQAARQRLSIYCGRVNVNCFPICMSRSFATSMCLRKNKKTRHLHDEEEVQEVHGSKKKDGPATNPTATPLSDTLKLNSLKSEIQLIQEKLKKGLGGLKSGGRFDTAVIEALRVDISKLKAGNDTIGTKEPQNDDSTNQELSIKEGKKQKTARNKHASVKTTASLKEMAQVIPRGAKTVLIMLNEAAFAKPVMSTLLGSQFSLNPTVSASNPLELVVPIPPPSAELRSLTLTQVDKFKDKADFALRDGRADMQKELRALQLGNHIRPDDYHDVQKKMEKLVEEAKAEIKRLCDASRKVLTQS